MPNWLIDVQIIGLDCRIARVKAWVSLGIQCEGRRVVIVCWLKGRLQHHAQYCLWLDGLSAMTKNERRGMTTRMNRGWTQLVVVARPNAFIYSASGARHASISLA